jgi:tRNA threonylcarbamoyladenosine biosynthesis protein TsaE
MQQKTIFIDTPEGTEKIASLIGGKLNGGECIELTSDLGGGKTTFTRGLVRGIGSLDNVSSPTFTIGKQYAADDITCYHFDFYRLQEAGLVKEELAEALANPKGIIIVEWADSVSDVLPEDRIIVKLEKIAKDSEARKLTFIYSNKYTDVIEGVV